MFAAIFKCAGRRWIIQSPIRIEERTENSVEATWLARPSLLLRRSRPEIIPRENIMEKWYQPRLIVDSFFLFRFGVCMTHIDNL